MSANLLLIDSQVNVIRIPRASVNGLWDALVASMASGSAAGSGLAESDDGLGQPSLPMFDALPAA